MNKRPPRHIQPRQPNATMDILIARQLESIDSGNGAYLETFLMIAKRAGLKVRIIAAPRQSFGNRPWASIHPRFTRLTDEFIWPKTVKIGSRYWTLSLLVWKRFFVRAIKYVINKLGGNIGIPSYLGRPLPTSEEIEIARVSNDAPRDITIAEYSCIGPVLKRLTSDTRKGVLMHDLLSDRGPRFRATGREPDFHEVTREEEADWCAASDLLIYASANEMDKFTPDIEGARAVWLRPEPPGYGEVSNALEPARVVFIGTTHAGNEDSLQHLLNDIWPIVIEHKPDLELWIAGSVGKTVSEAQANLPGVRILGRVENLEDVGGPASIGVAPTRLATGVSIKVVEYLMLQMTCVAYPLALEGFLDALDDLVVTGDTPSALAERILALVEDAEGRKSFAETGHKATAQALSNDEVVDFLRDAQPVCAVARHQPIRKSVEAEG